jgi:XRE family aerobic/anaerobic benzoate catabolism transcriptional regulator
MAASGEAMADLRRILEGRAAFYAKANLTLNTSGKSLEVNRKALLSAVGKAQAR